MTESETIPQNTVIIFHADCRDGCGAAWAAWKKFGERAAYIPRKTQLPPPEGLARKEIYILDYSYAKDTLAELAERNRSVIVIDHHETAREAVTAFPQNVFDLAHSGAVLTWTHFHPNTPVPKLLIYIEEHDLWKDTLPQSKEIAAALGDYPLTFAAFDELARLFEDKAGFARLAEKGALLREYIDTQVSRLAATASFSEFEGRRVPTVNYAGPYRSLLGNALATMHPPMAIIWFYEDGLFHVSLRSVGECDVGTLAAKYGGGGHRNAAGFKCARWEDLPFHFEQ
mgnify:CR=1 FL=1